MKMGVRRMLRRMLTGSGKKVRGQARDVAGDVVNVILKNPSKLKPVARELGGDLISLGLEAAPSVFAEILDYGMAISGDKAPEFRQFIDGVVDHVLEKGLGEMLPKALESAFLRNSKHVEVLYTAILKNTEKTYETLAQKTFHLIYTYSKKFTEEEVPKVLTAVGNKVESVSISLLKYAFEHMHLVQNQLPALVARCSQAAGKEAKALLKDVAGILDEEYKPIIDDILTRFVKVGGDEFLRVFPKAIREVTPFLKVEFHDFVSIFIDEQLPKVFRLFVNELEILSKSLLQSSRKNFIGRLMFGDSVLNVGNDSEVVFYHALYQIALKLYENDNGRTLGNKKFLDKLFNVKITKAIGRFVQSIMDMNFPDCGEIKEQRFLTKYRLQMLGYALGASLVPHIKWDGSILTEKDNLVAELAVFFKKYQSSENLFVNNPQSVASCLDAASDNHPGKKVAELERRVKKRLEMREQQRIEVSLVEQQRLRRDANAKQARSQKKAIGIVKRMQGRTQAIAMNNNVLFLHKNKLHFASSQGIHPLPMEFEGTDEKLCVAASSSSSLFAFSDSHGMLSICQLDGGKAAKCIESYPSDAIVTALAFSADGRKLAVNYYDQGLVLFSRKMIDGKSRWEPKEIPLDFDSEITAISFAGSDALVLGRQYGSVYRVSLKEAQKLDCLYDGGINVTPVRQIFQSNSGKVGVFLTDKIRCFQKDDVTASVFAECPKEDICSVVMAGTGRGKFIASVLQDAFIVHAKSGLKKVQVDGIAQIAITQNGLFYGIKNDGNVVVYDEKGKQLEQLMLKKPRPIVSQVDNLGRFGSFSNNSSNGVSIFKPPASTVMMPTSP